MEYFYRIHRINYVLTHNQNYNELHFSDTNLIKNKMIYSFWITSGVSVVLGFKIAQIQNIEFSGSSELIRKVKLTNSIVLASLITGLAPAIFYFYQYSECLDSLISLGVRNNWLIDHDYKMIEDPDYFKIQSGAPKERS